VARIIKTVSHLLSIAIEADPGIWGDQNKNGKAKSIFKFERNIYYWT